MGTLGSRQQDSNCRHRHQNIFLCCLACVHHFWTCQAVLWGSTVNLARLIGRIDVPHTFFCRLPELRRQAHLLGYEVVFSADHMFYQRMMKGKGKTGIMKAPSKETEWCFYCLPSTCDKNKHTQLYFLQMVEQGFPDVVEQNFHLDSWLPWLSPQQLATDLLHGIKASTPRLIQAMYFGATGTKVLPNFCFCVKLLSA